ncbi:MAG: hypothetical protein J7K68_01895, partial [Candidatus Diapherotrites archaeon]|nr:hypothetical protein [Candidatus Diapherotrites archaeon]
ILLATHGVIGPKRIFFEKAFGKDFNEFKKILSKMPFRYTYREEDSKFRINSVQLAKYLRKFGTSRSKYIPDYIKNATPSTIMAFLKYFNMGDGDIHQGQMRFHSSSKKLVDDLQEMIIRVGLSSTITVDKRRAMLNPKNKKIYASKPVYSLEIRKTNKTSIRKNNVSVIEYDGYVGCVTVSTGFVIVRRNNRVAVCGNTGGMGSYSSGRLLPFMREEDLKEAQRINEMTCEAIREQTGEGYKGIMYGGFMATSEGVKLVEYNARFGDPEALNVLPLLETDFVQICEAIIEQELADIDVVFSDRCTVCKYLVPEGYPENPRKRELIEIPKDIRSKLYYGSVEERDGLIYTTTSRSIAFVGIGETLEEAEKIVQGDIDRVRGKLFYRRDIGTKELIQRRIDHMKSLRG